jgi:methyl-accepting chemotaxis protein
MAGNIQGGALASSNDGMVNLAAAAAQVGERLGETAQAIDEIARSTCLLALDVAVKADKPGNIGMSLTAASREVQRLAARTHQTLSELESMLKAVEGRAA